MSAPHLPEEAYLCALASLPDATPARLGAVGHLTAEVAFGAIAAGRWAHLRDLAALLDRPVRRDRSRRGGDADGRSAWQRAAASLDVAAAWDRHRRSGTQVWSLADPAMPATFAADLEPPRVLFLRGDRDLLARPAVAIVGTRRCTRYGRDIARALGRDLAAGGTVVVSGLAAGVDTAAHQGVLDVVEHVTDAGAAEHVGRPVAVVGTGLDVPYPAANRELWGRVERAGVLCGEYPLGTRPAPWRFPARNRLIVAASDVVVVVESHARGGALLTARDALARGRTVLAVPGPIHSPASAGTNALLSEGAHPCLGIDDVVCALGLSVVESDARTTAPVGDAFDAEVLDALGWQPASLDSLALRTGAPLARLVVAVTRLVAEGRIAEQGGFYEQVAR